MAVPDKLAIQISLNRCVWQGICITHLPWQR